MVYVEWLLREPCLWLAWCIALVDGHPGIKEISQVASLVASSTATCHYGLCLDQVCCMNPGPTWQADVRDVGWNESVWWSGELFQKGLVLVFSRLFHTWLLWNHGADWVIWEKCTTSRECQTKYLAMSPVMDSSERMDLWLLKDLLITIS
jgi:hypothetical protein